ncbi:aldehyde dehydrogenase domain-containing protein [Lentinula aciculospora]|uniref:Aldehyde dehydrogenase domain-containing protein n=1 Tax=Lentinula aciculospora TaxID=153920 RepID=A0A9W9AIQ0_9AGAR|nr:aldehyde dehydrogenase domain-containing protein [Lentinula aciculospora]
MSFPFTSLYINGAHLPSSNSETFKVISPSTHQVVGVSASASSEDCQNAIIAASNAFRTWERTLLSERRNIFLRAAELLQSPNSRKYKDEIERAVREETGAMPVMTNYNWVASIGLLRDLASLGNVGELGGLSFPSERISGGTVVVERRAMGVIFASAPWNSPVNLTLRAILIPILCGNTIVFRSSEQSPRSQAIICDLFEEAGLPSGVFNFISTSRENAPRLTAEIIANPLVRKINFTGSDRVGRAIAIEAANHLKPCVLELGGKAPVVVLHDANITEAAKAIVHGALLHSGQICMSTERVIIQRKVYESLRDEICELVRTIKAGDSQTTADTKVRLGPLFSESSAQNVLDLLHEAQEAGANILAGDLKREKAFIQPHVMTDVKSGSRIWKQETFGPVIILTAVDSVEEAVELANASDYSLTAALWTSNLYAAKDVASRIHSGYVNINGSTIHSESAYGLVGLGGSSGYGRFSINDFTDMRVVVTHPPGPTSYPLFN